MQRLRIRLPRLPKPAARWARLFPLGALVGIVGGLAAAGVEWGLHHGTHLLVGRLTHLGSADAFRFHWGVLLLPALGGLISGLLVYFFAPQAHGHGTDTLTRAFHHNLGQLPLRGPVVKSVANVAVLSCGGSTGPEGPIAALGAAIGSSLAGLFKLSPRDVRVLLVAGCGAGVGAIFHCPLGGALFAAGVLYKEPEFESDAIIPAFVASVMSYSTYMLIWGYSNPLLIGADALRFDSPLDLVPYAALGPLCAGLSTFLYFCMKTVEHRIVPRVPGPRWAMPVLGGLATGALACLLPQVMDGNYQFIRNAMSGALWSTQGPVNWWGWTAFFAAVAVVKCIASACTVGSGGSGGVLGPAVFLGGVAGALVGSFCEAVAPNMFPEELRRALIPVGMAGVLAAAMRTPMSAIVMTTEMTGGHGLIVPLMLVCVTAYVLGRKWGLNAEQVRTAAESPAHAGDVLVHVLESARVCDVVHAEWPMTARPESTLAELIERAAPGTRPVFAILKDNHIVGIISVADILRITNMPGLAEMVIAEDMMTTKLDTVGPDDDLYAVLNVFRRANHDVLPVVARDRTRHWLGMVTRESIYDMVRSRMEATQQLVMREHDGLAIIEQHGRLQQLAMGMSPLRRDLIQKLLVPLQAIGKTIRESNFRREYGVQIVAVEQPDGSLQCPPDLDAKLTTDQRLIAIAPAAAVSSAAPGKPPIKSTPKAPMPAES